MANNNNPIARLVESRESVQLRVTRHSKKIRNHDYLVVTEISNQVKDSTRSVFTFSVVRMMRAENGAVDITRKALSGSFFARTNRGLTAFTRTLARDTDGYKTGYVYTATRNQAIRVTDSAHNVRENDALNAVMGSDEIASDTLFIAWTQRERNRVVRDNTITYEFE